MMAFLVSIQVLVLTYAFNTLSALRTFVETSAIWSGAHKNAIISLYEYADTKDPKFYQDFLKHLEVPEGLKKGREAMMACEDLNTCHELRKIAEENLGKAIPTDDISKAVRMIRHLRGMPKMQSGVEVYQRGDALLPRMIEIGKEFHATINRPDFSNTMLKPLFTELNKINSEVGEVQAIFASRMQQGYSVFETIIIGILILSLLIVGSISAYMIYRLIKFVNLNIEEYKNITSRVSDGDFSTRATIYSNDEFGDVASGLNEMAEKLKVALNQKNEAESANQIKTLFLANMSHELRTPLTMILGMIGLLKDNDLSKGKRDKYLNIIERTGHNLEQIINDLLDISKIEAGHLDMTPSSFELNDFLDELLESLQLLAQQNQNTLSINIASDIPNHLKTDKTRLRQIFTNLIGNGLKFTQAGKVSLDGLIQGDKLVFLITDTGIGISKDQHKNLFKPFSQLDRSSTRKYGGTGLGLLLSRRLTEALGGTLSLEKSTPGKGSQFKLELPLDQITDKLKLTRQPPSPSPQEVYRHLQGKKVLLVEDSQDLQMLLRLFLEKQQLQVDFANNGKEGIERAQSNGYDLVLMDMQMPVVDGYTATETLREIGFKKPIIALTAHAMKNDRERCLKVGCNDYMTKPIDPDTLYKTIDQYIA